MKFLAIEKDISVTDWDNAEKILKDEATEVYNLYLSGSLREIYFNEKHGAVLILECKSKDEALQLLEQLPLVRYKLIEFELMELLPYTGYQRIIR
jgi:muconolactone delta-isomerase